MASTLLPDILARFPNCAVLVVGDVMLDEYAWGEVQRISPEAPVPVVEVRRRGYAPGGAANVAVNIAALGGRVTLAGVIGADPAADRLRAALAERGVASGGLLVEPDRPTTAKLRIVAHSQQIVRVDSESRGPLPPRLEDRLLETLDRALAGADVCVISDYGKGVVSQRLAQRLIGIARFAGKPVIVDPKGSDYAKYRGASLVTPNLREAEQAAGLSIGGEVDLLRAGARLRGILESNALLITRGADGMSLFVDGTVHHVPSVARSVFDVTGAGDTVIATLALALAARASLDPAARLANLAAGIVVGKAGAANVTPVELAQAVEETSTIV